MGGHKDFLISYHEENILTEVRRQVLVLVHGGWKVNTLVCVLETFHMRVLVGDDWPSLKMFCTILCLLHTLHCNTISVSLKLENLPSKLNYLDHIHANEHIWVNSFHLKMELSFCPTNSSQTSCSSGDLFLSTSRFSFIALILL